MIDKTNVSTLPRYLDNYDFLSDRFLRICLKSQKRIRADYGCFTRVEVDRESGHYRLFVIADGRNFYFGLADINFFGAKTYSGRFYCDTGNERLFAEISRFIYPEFMRLVYRMLREYKIKKITYHQMTIFEVI
jgi:hypothetical protein